MPESCCASPVVLPAPVAGSRSTSVPAPCTPEESTPPSFPLTLPTGPGTALRGFLAPCACPFPFPLQCDFLRSHPNLRTVIVSVPGFHDPVLRDRRLGVVTALVDEVSFRVVRADHLDHRIGPGPEALAAPCIARVSHQQQIGLAELAVTNAQAKRREQRFPPRARGTLGMPGTGRQESSDARGTASAVSPSSRRRAPPDAGCGRSATDSRRRSSGLGEALPPPGRSPAPARRARVSGSPTFPFVRAARVSWQDTAAKHRVPPGSRLAGPAWSGVGQPGCRLRGRRAGRRRSVTAGEWSGPPTRGLGARNASRFPADSSPGPTNPRPLRRYGVPIGRIV